MIHSLWFWTTILILLVYFWGGYIVIKAGVTNLNKEQEFEWTIKNIGYIIGWLPLIAITYIMLALNYNKMQPYKKPEDRDEDDDSSYH